MRTFRVEYFAEVNDECLDKVKKIQSPNIETLVKDFKIRFKNCKRITKIEEV